LEKHPAVKSITGSYYDDFADLLSLECKVVDMQQTSNYTHRIVDADLRMSRLITGMRKQIGVGTYHFEPDIVAAAEDLMRLINSFGEIQSKAYEEKSMAVEVLVADLHSPQYASKAELAGLTPWINKLENTHAEFDLLLRQRNHEWAYRPQERLQDIRRKIDRVYRQMIERINSAETFDDAGLYVQFIRELNTLIARYNEHNHHHPAPQDIGQAYVNSIATEPYTGNAVTPIPTVWLDNKLLALGKDFTLTYRRNIQPGTAQVNIIGKGKYNGRKEITFNIR
jgi:hypothetical protein